jgi:AsmA protein
MDVQVRGGVGVSLFPVIGASIADIVVTNGVSEVATVAKAKVGLKLLPLITGRVRISRMNLVKPTITIIRQKDGKLNIGKPGGRSKGTLVALRKLAVSEGSFLFTNLESGGETVLEGIDITAGNIRAGGTPGGSPLKTLSFSGEIRCRAIRAGNLTITDLIVGVAGKNGVFDAGDVRMNVFGGPGNGALHADFTGAEPQFTFTFAEKALKIEQLLQGSSKAKNMEGLADLSADLTASGRTVGEVKRSLRGQASLSGENIVLNGLDIDDVTSSLLRSRRFNLVDVGSFFLAGPLGPALTRGYRFGDLFVDSQGGKSVITRLVSVWKIEKGVAEAVDVAMATEKRRIAMTGGLNFADSRFEDVVVAVVDQDGCAAVKQKIRGPFSSPEIGNIDIFKSLTKPITNLLKSAAKLFSNKPCEVFYAGSVAPPKEAKRP